MATPEQVSEQVPEQVPDKYPTSTRQVKDELHTSNGLIVELVKVIGIETISISQMMSLLGLKHRPNFMEYHLNPAIAEGYVCLLYPDKPRHPRQRYLLTVKGMTLYNELKKGK